MKLEIQIDAVTKALKDALAHEIDKIVDQEALAAAERVRQRVSVEKQAIIERLVSRLKVATKEEYRALRFEIIIATDHL